MVGTRNSGESQHGDNPLPGAQSGQLEQFPASKHSSLLTIVASSPMRGSSIGPSDGVTRVFLHEPEDLAKLSASELDAHAAAVAQAHAGLLRQRQLIDSDCERREEQRQCQLVADRARKLAEKEQLEKQIAEIDAALAVMDAPDTAGNA